MFRENSRTTCGTNRDLVAFFPIRFLFSFFLFPCLFDTSGNDGEDFGAKVRLRHSRVRWFSSFRPISDHGY